MIRISNFVITLFLFILSLAVYANVPIHFMSNRYYGYGDMSISYVSKIDNIVNTYINTTDNSPYSMIAVQAIYKKNGDIDHLILVLDFKDSMCLSLMRINVDPYLNVTSVQRDYHLSKQDIDQQPSVDAGQAKCPSPGINFIIATPDSLKSPGEEEETNYVNALTVYDIVKNAWDYKYTPALQVSATVTTEALEDWLSCGSQLYGFFYTGHGNTDIIQTKDGILTTAAVKNLKINFGGITVLQFSSCKTGDNTSVNNWPTVLTVNSKAGAFIGSPMETDAIRNNSFDYCFWSRAVSWSLQPNPNKTEKPTFDSIIAKCLDLGKIPYKYMKYGTRQFMLGPKKID